MSETVANQISNSVYQSLNCKTTRLNSTLQAVSFQTQMCGSVCHCSHKCGISATNMWHFSHQYVAFQPPIFGISATNVWHWHFSQCFCCFNELGCTPFMVLYDPPIDRIKGLMLICKFVYGIIYIWLWYYINHVIETHKSCNTMFELIIHCFV